VAALLRRRAATRRSRTSCAAEKKKGSFGPQAFGAQKKAKVFEDEIGQRIDSVVRSNKKGIISQLQQYNFAQVDGFLGGDIFGYPDKIRDPRKKLFDRGWFAEEPEDEAGFKIGPYRVQNEDRAMRFKAKILSDNGDDGIKERLETQYEVAPDVVNFSKALMLSIAPVAGKAAGCSIQTNVAFGEMHVLCGQGARFDRRVSNVYGWTTKQGFAPDPRKVAAVYFANPNYRMEHGGALQLEGVISPTGQVRIPAMHDRLVLFWADKVVWSMSPSQVTSISDHQFFIMTHLMAKEHSDVKYDPNTYARWFPNLRDKPMEWPPPGLPTATQGPAVGR
jgi:hypothetical protein